jgi:hypothetical protein
MPQKLGAYSLQIAGTFSPAPQGARVCTCIGGPPPLPPPGLGSSRADLMGGGQDGRSPNRWCARPLAMAQ